MPQPHCHPVRRPVAAAALACALALIATTQPAAGAEITLGDLNAQLTGALEIESTLQRRRALKNVARDAEAFSKAHAQSPERFAAVSVIFAAQRELLLIRSDERTRSDLLATCRTLLDAPDDYAVARLRAEYLLTDIALDAEGATEHRRAVAIAELADRYRDTPAEVDSLMLASEVAFNLGQAELLGAFRRTLVTKFDSDLRATAFLQDRFAQFNTSVPFRGTFTRADGDELVFPFDRMGHVYLSCFWSQDAPRLAERMAQIKAFQQQYPGRFEVFSYNLDQLPDAGKGYLTKSGLDWTAMRLPGGQRNETFRGYGGKSEFHVRITNLNGYINLTPIGKITRGGGRIKDLTDYVQINLEHPRYLAMFQSLRAGEFLVQDPVNGFDPKNPPELDPADRDAAAATADGNAVPDDTLRAIQGCFVPPPMRYRLAPDEAAARFEQCIRLCDRAIDQHADAHNLWAVYNRKIVAQIALWYHRVDPSLLRAAAADAKRVLAAKPPASAQLVAEFALTMQALRSAPDDARQIVPAFLDRVCQGQPAPGPMQMAAATLLAMNAADQGLVIDYRQRLLGDPMGDPRVWPLGACLQDASTHRRLFRANFWGVEVMKRWGMRWYGGADPYDRTFGMALQTLDGKPFAFPDDDPENLNIAVIVEPPADEQAATDQRELIERFKAYTAPHLHHNVNMVLVFAQGEPGAIRNTARAAGWGGPIATIKGGLANPDVLRLGVFAADYRPNTFFVHPSGKIVWAMTGMNHHTTSTNAVAGLSQAYIRQIDIETGERALADGDYRKALKTFSGSFPPGRFNPPGGNERQRMGRLRAYMALGDYAAARADLDQLVAAHEAESLRRVCGCSALADLLTARAGLHEALGDSDRAEADRRRAAMLECPPSGRKTHAGIERNHRTVSRRLTDYQARGDNQAALEYLNGIIARGEDGRQPERARFATVLRQRSETLAKLGQADAADRDRRRADALTQGIAVPEPDAQSANDTPRVTRYVDLVDELR